MASGAEWEAGNDLNQIDNVNGLVDSLVALSKFQNFLELHNADPKSKLEGKLLGGDDESPRRYLLSAGLLNRHGPAIAVGEWSE